MRFNYLRLASYSLCLILSACSLGTANPPLSEQDVKQVDSKGQKDSQTSQIEKKSQEAGGEVEKPIQISEKVEFVRSFSFLQAKQQSEVVDSLVRREKDQELKEILLSLDREFFFNLVKDDEVFLVRSLIESGNVNGLGEQDKNGKNALHLARSAEMVSLLFDWKVELRDSQREPKMGFKDLAFKVSDRHGHLPIHDIALRGDARVVNIMLQKMCNIKLQPYLNARTEQGQTLVMLAIESGDLQALDSVLGCSYVHTDTIDDFHQSAAHYAAREEDPTLMYSLILHSERLPDMELRDINFQRPLDIAIEEKNEDVAEIIKQFAEKKKL